MAEMKSGKWAPRFSCPWFIRTSLSLRILRSDASSLERRIGAGAARKVITA